jgi:hypothetical protein
MNARPRVVRRPPRGEEATGEELEAARRLGARLVALLEEAARVKAEIGALGVALDDREEEPLAEAFGITRKTLREWKARHGSVAVVDAGSE